MKTHKEDTFRKMDTLQIFQEEEHKRWERMCVDIKHEEKKFLEICITPECLVCLKIEKLGQMSGIIDPSVMAASGIEVFEFELKKVEKLRKVYIHDSLGIELHDKLNEYSCISIGTLRGESTVNNKQYRRVY